MTNLHAPLIIVTPYYEDGAATKHLIEELMSQLSGKLPGQFHESSHILFWLMMVQFTNPLIQSYLKIMDLAGTFFI